MSKKLFVRNLVRSMSSSSLEDLFTNVGDVVSCSVPVDPSTGVSLCVGYIEMSTDQQASDCISRFNGYRVDGMTLTVASDQPRPVMPLPLRKKTKSGKLSQLRSR